MSEWASGNIYIREMRLDVAGACSGGHTHNFDHTTIVFTGSVHVTKWARRLRSNGEPWLDDSGEAVWLVTADRDVVAPGYFLIEANAKHDIVALEPNTVCWCVYAHRSPQGEVIQSPFGWNDAYV